LGVCVELAGGERGRGRRRRRRRRRRRCVVPLLLMVVRLEVRARRYVL
jgi:hypothetical protein